MALRTRSHSTGCPIVQTAATLVAVYEDVSDTLEDDERMTAHHISRPHGSDVVRSACTTSELLSTAGTGH